MRFLPLGFCCAQGCNADATKRAEIGIGRVLAVVIPLCDAHLDELKIESAWIASGDATCVITDSGASA